MSENDHFSCIDFNFSGDLDWRRAWSHVNYDTGRKYCNFVFFNYADVCRIPCTAPDIGGGAGVCYNSLFYQNGNNPKTRAAFLATLPVMLLLFIPIYIITWRSGSYGLNELQISEDDFMYYYSTDLHINMLHVGIFVTVFSTLGAVIDTALSVTSSVYEVWTHKNSLTAKELTASGYQVGKEIIGTTVNTLLFAYLGGTILLFSYIQTQQYTMEIILNSQFLFQDVAVMLSGAVACLITVPVSIRCIIRQIS